MGVWMERCYQKSGFAFQGLLNQKIQLSQSSLEGKVYFLKKYGEHQGVFQSVKPDKAGIDHRNQRIVHLKIGDDIRSFGFHPVQGTGFTQSQQRTAVSIR